MSASKSVTLRNAWEGSFLLIEDSDPELLRLTINEEGTLAVFDTERDDLTNALTQLGIIGGEIDVARDTGPQPDELEFNCTRQPKDQLKTLRAGNDLRVISRYNGDYRSVYLKPADAERLAKWILATLPGEATR